jgi:hypothetical protein
MLGCSKQSHTCPDPRGEDIDHSSQLLQAVYSLAVKFLEIVYLGPDEKSLMNTTVAPRLLALFFS